MSKVRGRFPYEGAKDSKKKQKKDAERKLKEALRADDARKKRQALCNHIGRNDDEAHLRVEDGYNVCEICGARILRDPEDLTPEKVEAAVDIIYSVLSIARVNMSVSEKYDDKITQALEVVMGCPNLVNELKNLTYDDVKKKKKKGKKHKKHDHDNDYGSYRPIIY